MLNECIAYDDDGSIMTRTTINTLTPIAYVAEARAIALFHLQNVEGSTDSDVNTMLPVALGPIGVDIITHYSCSRPGYDNTIRNQIATMAAEFLNGTLWVSDQYYYIEDIPDVNLIKAKFCFVLGDENEVLAYLGLERK